MPIADKEIVGSERSIVAKKIQTVSTWKILSFYVINNIYFSVCNIAGPEEAHHKASSPQF